MLSLFDVNNTLIEVFGYPLSHLEFWGTMLNIASVYLIAKKNIWSWPIGNVAVVLFALLFFQIQLYSDFIEQIYFLIAGFYGWWKWHQLGSNQDEKEPDVRKSSRDYLVMAGFITAIGTLALTLLVSNIHIWLPQIFDLPAQFPLLDSFTTMMSFTATVLMAQKRVECWYLWIAVDVIGIGLYAARGVLLLSLLYALFLVLATNGLITWRKTLNQKVAA